MLNYRGFKGRRRLFGEQRGTYDDVHMLLNITLFIVIDNWSCVHDFFVLNLLADSNRSFGV